VEGEEEDDEDERQTRPVTNSIAGLAKEAAQLFHSRSYQSCLLILNQLLVQNETDPKGHSEELAQETEEQQDDYSSSTSASPNLTGSDGSGRLPATPAMISPDVASMEDHDSSIPTLNTAVMMYHLQQYADVISGLEPLYSNIEPIDEACSNLLWSLCACSGSYLSTFPMLCNILTGVHIPCFLYLLEMKTSVFFSDAH